MNGFMLALSTAGGAAGNRQAPLLTTAEDWRALGETAERLVLVGVPYDIWRLLAAVLETVRRQTGDTGDLLGITNGLAAVFTRKVLHNCAEKWKTDGSGALSIAVHQYLEISERLTPLPPSPDFRPMWDISWNASKEEMESFVPDDTALSLGGTNWWFGGGTVILRNEPRFLRQVDFPSAFTAQVRHFLLSLAERARLDLDLTSEDECREEDDRLDFLSGLVETIAELFSELENELTEAGQAIDEGKKQVNCKREGIEEAEAERKAEQEDRAMHDVVGPPGRTKSLSAPEIILPGSTASPSVDLVTLFEDL
jgi:hypothetical protein